MKHLLSILFLLTFLPLSAQYYNQGQDPFNIRWQKTGMVIHPDNFAKEAQKVASILETTQKDIHFGLSMPAQKIPFVLHTYNLRSNGLVVWTPKRAELVPTPPVSTYAMPWLEQLTIHEYRHVVQMSNLRRGFTKVASYIAGEQALGAGAMLLPVWFLEGDATFAETLFSPFGRGLQPEFTLEYRAYLEGRSMRQFDEDKWFCGSYKEYIPDHYKLGYQIINHTYNRFGEGFWEKIVDYSAKHPFFISPRSIAYKRFFKTSTRDLLLRTFSDLKTKWDSLPQRYNSAEVIKTSQTSYTVYSHPQMVDDSTIVALKYDLDKPHHFVLIDTKTSKEKRIAYTGAVYSRPIYHNREIIWSEVRPSTFRTQKNKAVVCRMGLDGKKSTIQNEDNLFFATPYKDGFAALSYTASGKYFLKEFDNNFLEKASTQMPEDVTFHALAWDSLTNTLSTIALTHRGMFLAAIEDSTIRKLTPPSYVTVNNLTASAGKLAFNSIQSGIDECHILDIASGKEYRTTTSHFGSIMPTIAGDKTVQVTYSRKGYNVSLQKLDTLREVMHTSLPENIVNMPMAQFNISREIDTTKETPTKRYSKGGNMINVHSWFPLSYNPMEMTDDRNIEFNIGATVISQNSLGNTVAYLTGGYANSFGLVKGAVRYTGFAPQIEVDAEYGGGYRYVYRPRNLATPANAKKQYLDVGIDVSLPITLSGGYQMSSLIPSVTAKYYNSMIYNFDKERFDNGFMKMEASLAYSWIVRKGYRDIAPRWGYSIKGTYGAAPFNKMFGSLYSLSGMLYTPGILRHHSLRINAAAQYQDTKTYNFSSNVLFPRGCTYDIAPERLFAVTGSYRFPFWYPDNGIPSVIYFKRLTGGFFAGYSKYREYNIYDKAYSYGAELIMNTSPLRMSTGTIDLTLSLYKTSQSKNLGFGVGISVGF